MLQFFCAEPVALLLWCPSRRKHTGLALGSRLLVVIYSGLLLVFSGDSTIIQQFQVLGEILQLRDDFHPVTGSPDAERLQVRPSNINRVWPRVFYTTADGLPQDAHTAIVVRFGKESGSRTKKRCCLVVGRHVKGAGDKDF